ADPDKLMALGIFVNRHSPLARLDFRQLDAIFGAQHLGGAPANIRTWGQLDDITPAGGKHIDGYQRAVDAVATDPDGIAVTVAGYHNPGAKLVAVAIT